MAIQMQHHKNMWTIYIPFIRCKELHLFSSAKIEPNAVNLSILSCDKVYKWRPQKTDIVKYTNGHIYETTPPICIKFVAKCPFLNPFFSEMKVNLCERIP